MKKTLFTLMAICSFGAMANTEIYKNNSGCVVEKEITANGVVLYVSKGNKNEVVGFGKDYSFATFAYCSEKFIKINAFEGRAGAGILISCSEHQNDNAITRGRVDIEIMAAKLTKISIDGQVKSLFGWKQDTKIECLDLVKQK